MTATRPRRRPTYAGIAATLALALSIGVGGAYAAPLIGTSDLRKGAVTTAKLHKNAVKSTKIKDGEVRQGDLAADAVTSAAIRDGSVQDSDLAASARGGKVLVYSLGGFDFSTTPQFSRTLPTIPGADPAVSGWTIHLVRASGNIYPIPGEGVNGTSTYRSYITPGAGGTANVVIARSAGTGEAYVDVVVVRTLSANSGTMPVGPRVAPRPEH
ncbi:hypothetical protein [Nocardioides sp. BYT-33-1]|uniref:hypothetical protein n=1 Tax=Nocardioides sp. BYT-33-1 TaxID=3416952 RepID=UPI003F5315FF